MLLLLDMEEVEGMSTGGIATEGDDGVGEELTFSLAGQGTLHRYCFPFVPSLITDNNGRRSLVYTTTLQIFLYSNTARRSTTN